MLSEVMSARNRLRLRLTHSISRFLEAHSFKGSRRLRSFLIKLLAPTPRGSTIVQTLYGFDIIVDPVADKGLEKEIYYYGTYEAGTLDVIRRCLRAGDTFIDVGANIGFISLFASHFVGANGVVYSFEPVPEIFKILQRNISLNEIGNILAYNFALGSTSNSATIHYNWDKSRGSASLIPYKENSRSREVCIQTLDEFVTENRLFNIRMVKIDVEGWELEVLKGSKNLLSSPSAPIICVEYSNLHKTQGGQLLNIYDFILSINHYQIYKLEKGKSRKSRLIRISSAEDLPYHDNLFCFLPADLENLKHVRKL